MGTWAIDMTGVFAGASYPDYTESIADVGSYANDIESMADAVDGTRNMHSVTHNLVKVAVTPSSSTWTLRDNTYGGTAAHSVSLSHGLTAKQQLNHLVVPSGAAIAQARVPLYSREMVNGLVSLYELGDIQRAFQAIPVHLLWATFRYVSNIADKRGVWNATQDYLHELRKVMKVNRGASYSEWMLALLKQLSGMSLAWKFGWKPFVDDVQKTITALRSWQANVNRVLSKEYTCVGRYTTTVKQRDPGVGCLRGGQFRYDVTCDRTTQVTHVAGVKRKLNPDLSALDGLHRAVLSESLGLRLSADKVWAVVPWSFVWDWIIPIGTFLEQFGSVGTDPTRVVDGQKWESTKTLTTARFEGRVTILHPTTGQFKLVNSNLLPHTGSGTRSSYVRTVGASWSTPPVYIPNTQMPSFFALWTSVELAIQKMDFASRRRAGRA